MAPLVFLFSVSFLRQLLFSAGIFMQRSLTKILCLDQLEAYGNAVGRCFNLSDFIVRNFIEFLPADR